MTLRTETSTPAFVDLPQGHSPENPDVDAAQERARAVDAAFDRSDTDVGTAVVKLVLNGADLEVAAPRVERALRAGDEKVRSLGHTAAGDLARLQGRLTPALYGLLRTAGLGSSADSAIKDVLTFVPFRELPGWFRCTKIWLRVRNHVEGRFLRLEDIWETVRSHLTCRS